MDRLFLWLCSASLAVSGVFTIGQRSHFSEKYARTLDMGEHHQVVGVLFLGAGAAMAWAASRARKS